MARPDALLGLTSRLMARRDALRRALSQEVSRLSERSGVVGCSDHLDAAIDSANAEICSRLAEIESRELADIERTLQRIAEGRYGRCESCGGRIPAKRLNVLPCTTRCIACQRLDEGRDRGGSRHIEKSLWPSVEAGMDADDGPVGHHGEFSARIDCTI